MKLPTMMWLGIPTLVVGIKEPPPRRAEARYCSGVIRPRYCWKAF